MDWLCYWYNYNNIIALWNNSGSIKVRYLEYLNEKNIKANNKNKHETKSFIHNLDYSSQSAYHNNPCRSSNPN